MNFTYTYRSSDGERHTAEIDAESRDAAFAKIRTELGIKPIKVVATEEGSGKSAASPRVGSPSGKRRSRRFTCGATFTYRFRGRLARADPHCLH